MELYREQDVIRAFGRKTFEAGRSYLRQGRVLAFDWDEDFMSGKVLGSARYPYEQTIDLEFERGGVDISGECTCPVGYNCKHVAAVLLFGLRQGVASEPAKPPTPAERAAHLFASARPAEPPQTEGVLPPLLSHWLEEFVRAGATADEHYPAAVAQRLVYVLTVSSLPSSPRNAQPGLGVRPISARLLKDGRFSDSNRAYDATSALAGHGAKFLRPSDLRILRAMTLLKRTYYETAGTTSLVGEGGDAVLADILATGRARWDDVNGPALSAGPPRPGRIVWQPAGEAALAPRLECDGGGVALRAIPPVYVDPDQGLVGPIETAYPPKVAAALLAAPEVPAEAVGAFNAALAKRAPEIKGIAAPEPVRERIDDVAPVPVLRLLTAELPTQPAYGRGYYAYGYTPLERVGLARLSFRYGPVTIPLSETKRVVRRLQAGRLIELHRDEEAERRAVATLLESGFDPVAEQRPGVPPAQARDFVPEGDDLAWLDAQYHVLPELKDQGWEVAIDADFPARLLRSDGAVEAEIREGSGIDWLDLHLGVMVDGERIDLIGPIVAMIEAGGFDPAFAEAAAEADEAAYLPLGDGRVLAVPAERLAPIVAAIRDLALAGASGEGRLRLAPTDLGMLAAFEAAVAAVWKGGERLREMGRRLTESGGIPPAVLPENFRATLRPYQHEGVSWLAFLREVGFGGVLADDMGLGKTVQALALLAIEKAKGRLDGPALIVAPTSLMGNWRREAERFAPDLKVLTLHGLDRAEKFGAIPEHDLVLTTYPLIFRDHAVLAERTWSMMVLDEAQTIKNPTATTTQKLFEIEARHRVCLTGTPLENNLDELWSLFAFACPGLLGERKHFSKAWRGPIERHGDRERMRLLARRVRPFLLRRTKAEVARELPPKTEMVERIDLEGPQRDVYEAIRLSMHARVSAAITERGWARSRIIILDALLKLRQACCDPRLLKKATQDVAEAGSPAKRGRPAPSRGRAKVGAAPGSAKLDRLEEMLVELLAEGRRILVFSQFTSMLALIEERLNARRIRYSLLTGRTRDREGAIRLFEEGAVGVFLVSLKAGGTGLNLIAADTVILYDPWWNPAVEDQAVDRAHRIGQTKPVFVHKLVAAGTIEEKMEVLKERKSALAQSLFDHDGGPTTAMTEADLDLLLAP